MAQKKQKLSSEALALFCRQSYMIIKSGIPLYEGMEMLQYTYEKTPYHFIFENLADSFLDTNDFYESLNRTEGFDTYLLKMVQIAQMTGKLEPVLENLAIYYEKQDQIVKEIKKAVTYPLVLIGMMSVVILVLLVQVLPVFERVYRSLGMEISETIQAASQFSIGVLALIFVGAMLFFLGVFVWKKGKKDKVIHILSALFPFVKKISQKLQAAQMAEVLYIFLKSGYSLNEITDLLPDFMHQAKAKKAAEIFCQIYMETGSMEKGLGQTGLFSPIEEKLIQTGDKTGNLEEALKQISKTNRQQAEESIARLISFIEPCLIGLLSLIIGGIMLSVMLPLANVLAGMI